MAQGKQQFDRNLPNRFWDNCDTDDGGQTMDKVPCYTLCGHIQAGQEKK